MKKFLIKAHNYYNKDVKNIYFIILIHLLVEKVIQLRKVAQISFYLMNYIPLWTFILAFADEHCIL